MPRHHAVRCLSLFPHLNLENVFVHLNHATVEAEKFPGLGILIAVHEIKLLAVTQVRSTSHSDQFRNIYLMNHTMIIFHSYM
jgi:hypothetical protein